jgi:hypothetical protein
MTATVAIVHTWRVADRFVAGAAGLDNARLYKTDNGVQFREVNAWVEESVAPGWIVAYRVVPQDGRPELAELRIFPDVWGDNMRPPGVWSGEYLGVGVGGVPHGGLSTKILRAVRLADPIKHAVAEMRQLREAYPDYFDPEKAPLGLSDRAARERSAAIEPLHSLAAEKQPRARTVADIELAKVAQLYVKVHYSVKAVARRLRWKPESRVRSRLILARRRGLLTSSGKRGRRGGQLTDAALKLLRSSKRPRGRGKGKGR